MANKSYKVADVYDYQSAAEVGSYNETLRAQYRESGLVIQLGQLKSEVWTEIKREYEKDPECILRINSDFGREYVHGANYREPQNISSETSPPGSHETLVSFIDAINQVKSFQANETELLEILNEFSKGIRLEANYGVSEIKVTVMEGYGEKIEHIIAAGTKVLDAVLYCTHKNDETNNFIFEVTTIREKSGMEAVKNLDIARMSLAASIIIVYIRGNLPSRADSDRPLPAFVTKVLFPKYAEIQSEADLAIELSSAPLTPFPARVLLKINTDNLPTPVVGRMKLSIAGNKLVRLATMASDKDKASKMALQTGDSGPILEFKVRYNANIELAEKLRSKMQSYNTNVKRMLGVHPLAKKRNVPSGFTLCMIKAILTALSAKGREDLVKFLIAKNMGVLSRDPYIRGHENEEGVRTWSLLTDDTHQFTQYTVDSLDSVWSETAFEG